MSFELYEVWAEDKDGHKELIESTRSRKQAFEFAEKCLVDGFVAGIIYQEDENGDAILIKRFENC